MKNPPADKTVYCIEIAPVTLGTIILLAIAAVLLGKLVPVILVLICALMLVGTLNPGIDWLEEHKIPRFTAIAIVFTSLLIVLGALAVFTVPAFVSQVANLIEQEPQLRAQFVKFLAAYPPTRSLASTLQHVRYLELIKSFSAEAMALSMSVFVFLAYGAGAFFLALYIMIDRDRLRGAMFAIVPRAHHIKLSRILIKLQTIVGGYVRGQIVTCVLMGVFLFFLLTAYDVPNAMAIAVFGGIADVLPFVGIFLTMIPAVLASLAVGQVPALIVFTLLLCYEEFESRILIPVVYGHSLRLPSSIVLFALIAGGTLYGVAGALLALPVAATLLMLIDELRVEMPGETKQADEKIVQENDIIGEAEYLRRTDGMSAEEAASIALEISGDRKQKVQDEKQSPPRS